jgi:hypothetical protein
MSWNWALFVMIAGALGACGGIAVVWQAGPIANWLFPQDKHRP